MHGSAMCEGTPARACPVREVIVSSQAPPRAARARGRPCPPRRVTSLRRAAQVWATTRCVAIATSRACPRAARTTRRARGARLLHLHHRLHSSGLRPAPDLSWVSGGGAWGACRLHLHHRLHSVGLHPAPGLGCMSGGGAQEARQLHLHHRLHSAGLRPASDLACPGFACSSPFPRRSPRAVLPPHPTPFSYYPPPHPLSPILYLPSPIPLSHPLSPSWGPILNPHTLTPPWSLQRRRPSSARPWYPQMPSDTIDQAPPP